MTFSSWFFSPRSSNNRRQSNKARPKRATRCRPILEALEDRSVPTLGFASALSVGNGGGQSNANDVAIDAAGNSYLTGAFFGTADLDPANTHPGDTDILTARGFSDAFVAKYAPDSSFLWARRMGGDAISGEQAFDVGRSIVIDGSGNIYVAGHFAASADFGSTTLVSAGGRDGFVAKLTSGGTIQWAKRWGAAGDDYGLGVGVDAAGNVYALGSSGTAGTYSNDILKFSSTGAAVWTKSIVTGTVQSFGELTVSASGSVFVCGKFKGTVDFDPGGSKMNVSSGPSYSAFVLKLTTTGKFDWVSPFVGKTVGSTSGYSSAESIVLDGSGNVIVGGYYGATVDFDPGAGTTTLPSTGGAFITKLNNSGGLVWAKALECANGPILNGMAVDAAGNIYATGQFTGTIDLDPGVGTFSRTSAGDYWSTFVVKLDFAGNFGWGESFGGTSAVVGEGIAVDSSGTIHLVGYYLGDVDFNPDPLDTYWLSNPGTRGDIFFVKLTQS